MANHVTAGKGMRLNKKRGVWAGTVFLVACLAAFLLSCAPAPQGRRFAAELEPYEEAVDTSCSYFHFLWAKSAELDGNLEEAQFAYEQALLCDRKAEYVMRNLAMLLIRMNKKQQAIQWVDKIIKLDPHDIGARSLLGNLYASIGRTDEAVATYRAILAEDPENLNVMLMLGSLYASSKQYGKAQKVLETLVRDHPNSYAGTYYLARLYREQRLYSKALTAYEKALSLDWSSALAYEAAALYEAEKRYDEAAKLYRRIIKEEFSAERARGLLANIYLQQGKTDKALDELGKLRKYATEPQKVDFAMGRVLLDAGRYDEAVRLFSRMVEENPGLAPARSLLVYALYKKGDAKKAKQILQGVKPDSKGYGDAVLMLARMLQDEKDLAGAEALLQENIADPGRRRLSFYVALAMLYREQGETEKGRRVFARAMKAYPDDAKVFFEYGLFLDRTGDMKGALAAMQEALRKDPHHAYALNYVGYTWADKGQNLKKAREYIEEAVSLKPKDGFIRDSLGWVYYKLGDYERAVAELQKAVALAPDDPAIHEHLGDAYEQAGLTEQAVAAYEQALALYKEEDKKEEVRRKLEAVRGP